MAQSTTRRTLFFFALTALMVGLYHAPPAEELIRALLFEAPGTMAGIITSFFVRWVMRRG